MNILCLETAVYLGLHKQLATLGTIVAHQTSSIPALQPYSHGQPKPTYFVAVGIPILDMTETPPEAQKCWKTFI
jgi:hypothetical protein